MCNIMYKDVCIILCNEEYKNNVIMKMKNNVIREICKYLKNRNNNSK